MWLLLSAHAPVFMSDKIIKNKKKSQQNNKVVDLCTSVPADDVANVSLLRPQFTVGQSQLFLG